LREHLIRAAALRVHYEKKAGRCIISGPIFLKVRRPDKEIDLFCEVIKGWSGERLDAVARLITRGFEPLEMDWDAARDFAAFITLLAEEEERNKEGTAVRSTRKALKGF